VQKGSPLDAEAATVSGEPPADAWLLTLVPPALPDVTPGALLVVLALLV